jgi:hypothetical protein
MVAGLPLHSATARLPLPSVTARLPLHSATARLPLPSLGIPVSLINPQLDSGKRTSLPCCVIAVFTVSLAIVAALTPLLRDVTA